MRLLGDNLSRARSINRTSSTRAVPEINILCLNYARLKIEQIERYCASLIDSTIYLHCYYINKKIVTTGSIVIFSFANKINHLTR